VPPVRWYERRPVQIGVAMAVLAAVVTGYFVATYTEPDRPWNPDVKIDSTRGRP
jgi:hypothetical protein